MDNQNEILKNTIAKNLSAYRKKAGLTQSQLAELLSYSDKAVSKWERGDGVPDIFVLKKAADIFGVSVERLISDESEHVCEQPEEQPAEKQPYLTRKRKFIISAISVLVVWMIATLVFSAMEMKGIKKNNWLAFIYAVPVSMVVAICFSGVWGRAADIMFTVSGFVWSLALSTFLSVKIANKWLIFIIMIPVQAIIVLSCNLGKKPLFRKKPKPADETSFAEEGNTDSKNDTRGENL